MTPGADGSDKQKSNPKNLKVKIDSKSLVTSHSKNLINKLLNTKITYRPFSTQKMYKPANPKTDKTQDKQPLAHITYPSTLPCNKPAKMPTAGEARLIANKRNRSPDANNNPAAKKGPLACDPKADATIPKPNEAFGKRVIPKPTVPLPTEAQLKQQEILRNAQLEQDALASKAAEAKRVKEAAEEAELLREATELAQSTDPIPAIPGPSTVTVTVPVQELPIEGVQFVEAPEADPNYAYPQSYTGNMDLTFVYTLAEDCLLYTSPSPRDRQKSRMPSSA